MSYSWCYNHFLIHGDLYVIVFGSKDMILHKFLMNSLMRVSSENRLSFISLAVTEISCRADGICR